MRSQSSRRVFLQIGGASLTILAGGCIGQSNANEEPKENETTSGLDRELSTQLGEAPEVMAEVEPTGDYEYIQEENRIRTGDSSTQPFPEWATAKAADHAGNYIRSLLDEKSLLGDGVTAGSGIVDFSEIDWDRSQPDKDEFSQDGRFAPIVSYTYRFDSDGNLIGEPDITFDKLVSETPRKAEVTVLIPEQEYIATVPVICRQVSSQPD